VRNDARLVPAALAGWACAAWLIGQRLTVILPVVAASLIATLVTLWWRKLPRIALVAVVVWLIATATAWQSWRYDESPLLDLVGRSVQFDIAVRTDARESHSLGGGSHFEGVVRRVSTSRNNWTTRDRVVVFVPTDVAATSDLVVGRRFVGRGKVRAPDTREHAGLISVTSLTPSEAGPWWWAASATVRQGLRDAVAHVNRPSAALVPALVAGDETRIDDPLREDFKRSGLTHLLAVSGTNLTIVLALTLGMLRWAGGRQFMLPVALASVAAFVIVARPEPSVQRAAVMGAIAVLAFSRGRAVGLRTLSAAVIVLVCLDPWIARSAGFVLSVSATAGIVLLGPLLTARLECWLPRPVAVAIAVPLTAHIACLPTITALSSQVSLVSVFANIVAAPGVAPATVLGLAGGLIALVSTGLGRVVATPGIAAAELIVVAGTQGARFDGASIPWQFSWWLMIPVAIVTLVGLWWVAARPTLALGLCLGLLIGIVRPPQPGWPPPGWVAVMCDVGQGSATVIRVGPQEALVIDVGSEDGPIDRCLRRLGVTRIALLVFSHGDADHVAGWRGAIGGREVAAVMTGPGGGPQPGPQDGEKLTPVVSQVWMVGEVECEVLWPPRALGNPNDSSIVIRATARGVRLLVTGDLGAEAQRRLVHATPDLTADVITMPHHGSADTWSGLFDAVAPQLAVISVGADNDYGHPAPAALAILTDRGIRAVRTDESSDVAISVGVDGRLRVGTR
jgi:competence protein ComEC